MCTCSIIYIKIQYIKDVGVISLVISVTKYMCIQQYIINKLLFTVYLLLSSYSSYSYSSITLSFSLSFFLLAQYSYYSIQIQSPYHNLHNIARGPSSQPALQASNHHPFKQQLSSLNSQFNERFETTKEFTE